jgi:biopolymer transport protein ExbD
MGKHKKKAEIEENITPNLIPMIDIMFLLLLFFMLGADMSQRELAGELVLPVASKVQEDDNRKIVGEENTTINIHHATDDGSKCAVNANGGICREEKHWKWAIRGQNYDKNTLKAQLVLEAEMNMEPAPDPVAKVILSARRVLIRADAAAPYGDIQKVIELCSAAKIYKVEVAAAQPTPEGGGG